jgi:hypothetical protein
MTAFIRSTGYRVFVLTWCQDLSQLYGSLLTFKTIRIGFPSSELVVFDNGSLPSAQIEIKKAAEAVGAKFYSLQTEVMHHDFVRWALSQKHGGQGLVLADPDLIFWESMESINVSTLLAGRLIPQFVDEFTKTITMPRLHTSLLMIPRPDLLMQRVHSVETDYFDSDLIRPMMVPMNGEWVRWDTLAAMFSAIPEECAAFDVSVLDCYDHIFCGSHLNNVMARQNMPQLKQVHEQAIADYSKLKGIWRLQQEYFLERAYRSVR